MHSIKYVDIVLFRIIEILTLVIMYVNSFIYIHIYLVLILIFVKVVFFFVIFSHSFFVENISI